MKLKTARRWLNRNQWKLSVNRRATKPLKKLLNRELECKEALEKED